MRSRDDPGRGALPAEHHTTIEEHDDHGENLRALEAITDDFTPPADACTTWRALYAGARKLGGDLGEEMIERTRGTVIGVMLGIVGTAAAQGAVAMIGFLIAGVPTAVLLGFATFFLSMIPIGPPLVWGGAALWLHDKGCLLYTSPSPRDRTRSRMPSSA